MAGRQEAAPPSQQPPVGRSGGGRGSSGRGAGKGPAGQPGKGPESHPIPNGTPSPPPEPAAPGGMSWAARVASASSKPAAPPAPPNSAAASEAADKAAPPAPIAPAPSSGVAGVKLPPGVEGKQPSIKFGDIDPTEVVPAKEQQRPAQPAAAQPVQPPAPPAGKPAVAAPIPAVPATPQQAQQPAKSAVPLPVIPAAGQPQVQRPGSFAAAAAGGKPAATAAVPVVVQPQAGMPPVAAQQGAPGRQQHGAGPRGGQARGPAGQQQPGVALNPALMAGGMYAQQQYGMPGMQFNMNPAAPTFGPAHGVGGMMYMPGGQGYFPGTFPQAAGWQGGQYGQYGMGPAAAMQAAAAAGAASSQQGMSGGGASMGAGPQQQPGGGGGYAAAAGAPKPTPTVTPPRERKILRIENPDTHEVIDLSKPVAGSQPAASQPAAAAQQQQQPPKGADRKAAAPAPAAAAPAADKAAAPGPPEAKKAEEKPTTPKTAADVLKSAPTVKAAAEAAAAAAPKSKPAAEAAPVAADSAAAPAAKAPAAPVPKVESPVAPASGAVVPAAAAVAPAAAAPKWGGSVSFKDKLMVDPAEKKRQEEEAARKRAEEEAAARKKAEEEAAAKSAAEEAKRKAEEEKRAAEEAARKKAEEAAAAKKAEEEAAKRKAEEEAAAQKKAEEAAAAAAAATAAAAAAAATAAAAAAAATAAAAAKQADEQEAAAKEASAEAAAAAPAVESGVAAKEHEEKEAEDGEDAAEISPFSSASMGSVEDGEIGGEGEGEADEEEEQREPPTGYENDTSGRKRYGRAFLFFYGNKCTATPKGIEAETFKQLSRENMPPMPPPGGRGPRGGPGGPGPDDRWQSGRMPAGPMPGPPGMRGDGRMMRQGSRRGGVEADQWERGKPLPPMPGMQQGGYDGRRGPPPGMRPMPGGPLPQLHKTQSAYKVGATRTDDPEEEQAQKRLKSLLNKITKDNFAKITGQIVAVINERKLAKTLSGFINQIFDKALTETHFAELYADLVAALNPALPHLKDDEGNDVQFRRTLLNKCQEEFEAGVTAMKAVSEREKHAKESGEAAPAEGDAEEEEEEEKEEEKEEQKEPAAEASEEGEVKDEAKAAHDAEVAAKKAALEARREERRKAQAELQARKRMLGNIVFVGQLFKKGVLTETVMHTCIKQLLEEVEQPKPEDVECMCKLLATVGGLLDSSTKTVKNFGGGSKPVATKDVMNVYFTRIEQLARNEAALDSRHRFMLMDLIDQRRNRWRPRKEAEGPKTIEEIHREEALKRSRSAMLDRQQSGRDFPRGGPRGGPPERRPPFDNRVDGPIRAMNRTPSNDFLGPGGGSFRPGGRPGPQRGGDRPGSGPPERTGSGRGPPAPPARGREEPPARKEEAREEEEESQAKGSDGGMDAEKMRSKVKGLLAELYYSKDVKEALTCVKEVVDAGADVASMFEVLLTHSLESKGTDWDMLHALLRSAVEDKALEAADLEKGARQLLDQLDDISVDVPKAPLQVGAVLGELVASGGADLKVLAVHIRTADANPDEIEEGEDTMLVGGGVAVKTLGALLQHLAATKGEDAAREAWQAAGESLPAFLPQADRDSEEERSKVVEQFGLAAVVA